MKKILLAAAALTALSGAAMADTITLTEALLDGVTVGNRWKKDRNNDGVKQSNSNSTVQWSSSGSTSVGGCDFFASCGGFFSANGNSSPFSASGNFNYPDQSNRS